MKRDTLSDLQRSEDWFAVSLPEIWESCLLYLKKELPEQDFNTWIRPLQAELKGDCLYLFAPNIFVIQWIRDHFLERIHELVEIIQGNENITVVLELGTTDLESTPATIDSANQPEESKNQSFNKEYRRYGAHLNPAFTFENFVRGESNEFAYAAATQVALKPAGAYNPLLIYGDVGLGKTHLMQAIAHSVLQHNPEAKILYLHSERFVANMIKALQMRTMEKFQQYYRSVDILLIDDIQFFAGKAQSQEEFFHTFNTLLENRKQIILTCDRYPKEIDGLEDRLKSRFGWGLTAAIEPPELETRVAILMSKAEQHHVQLSSEIAFFMAKRIRSNIRELEGALRRVLANADFTGKAITMDFVKETLKDLIHLQDKLVTIENIQKVVAEYYKIKMADLLSKRRNRTVVRPRQIAMTLAKELTNHSLPEIGDAFGGKDHTTVIHAHRTILSMLDSNSGIKEDYVNLIQLLTR